MNYGLGNERATMDEPPDNRESVNLIVLVAVILLVAATAFLLVKLRESSAEQDCVAQGRHDCAPVDPQQ